MHGNMQGVKALILGSRTSIFISRYLLSELESPHEIVFTSTQQSQWPGDNVRQGEGKDKSQYFAHLKQVD